MLKVLVVEDEEMIRKGIVLAVDWAALRLGAVDFLLKPFRDGDLEQAVTALQKRISSTSGTQDEHTLYQLKKGDKSKYVLEAMDYIGAHYAEHGIGVSPSEYQDTSDT